MIEKCIGHLARYIVALAIMGQQGVLVPGQARAQAQPRFAAASIKPSPRCIEDVGFHRSTPGRLMFPCISVRNLVSTAYSRFDGALFSAKQIQVTGGPDWIRFDHYEISARADGSAPIPQMAGPMLRALLEDRFGLKVHMESREKPVFALVSTAGGAKVRPPAEGSCQPFDFDALVAARNQPQTGTLKQCPAFRITGGQPKIAECHGMTMAEFAALALGSFVDRPVIDMTGLNGRFDIHLEALTSEAPLSRAWMIANGVLPPPDSPAPTVAPSLGETGAGSTVFEAVQKQLGLKLVPTRAPLPVLVIDGVERPSPN